MQWMPYRGLSYSVRLSTLEGLKIVRGSRRHRVSGGITFTPTTRLSRIAGRSMARKRDVNKVLMESTQSRGTPLE